MKIFLIGCGCGERSLTIEASEAIRQSSLLVGSRRLLEQLGSGKPCAEAVRPEEIASILKESGCDIASVLFSGDSGFNSGARILLPYLEGEDVSVLPGISSLQLFSAKLQIPWQGWHFCSAHGRQCDPVKEVCRGKPVFFLTGGCETPAELCRKLCEAGLEELPVAIGEEFGGDAETIRRGAAKDYVNQSFATLSVMLADRAPNRTRYLPGMPDDCFERAEGIPMTKREVRAMVLSLLEVEEDSVCWDIGTGTGSVAIELALHVGAVYGIERDENALLLAEANRRKLGAWNLRLIGGHAPEALNGLPEADAVFVGGTGGNGEEILRAVMEKSPKAAVCVTAVTIETLHLATVTLEAAGYNTEILQLSASRSRVVGSSHMMTAQNPIWLISGKKP
ncbi:MAG: precorrin-6y C5,15-methyltransferase (decarboxylating) subunit CbiE [Oscillospiraceae bacterium]|nr:precorrin-6y C5,15-methyltransferase (decarboxylating) subunit CbiE [Oscillospiraceae bacterium]